MNAKFELRRTHLLERLTIRDVRFVALFAAAGYGKSTLARQLTERFTSAHVCDLAGAQTADIVAQRIAETLGPDQGADAIVIENAEAVHRLAGGEERLARLLAQFPQDCFTVICSRVELDIPFLNFALPYEVVRIDEPALAFNAAELAAFFPAGGADVDAVYALTRGWPICVRLVARLAEIRNVKEVLDEMRAVDFALLYEYLVRNVIELLDPFRRSALIALALSELTDGDVRRLFGDAGERALKIIAASPFVSMKSGHRVLHPLIRTSVRRWYEDEANRMLRLTAERALGDDRVHAGVLYADLGDYEAAAQAVEAQALAFVCEPSNADFANVLQRLPREVLVHHAQLFAVAMVFAGLAISPEQRYRDAYAIRSRFDGSEAPADRMSIDGAMAAALMNLGRHTQALSCIAYLRKEPGLAARLNYEVFTGAILARMGRYSDACRHWPEVCELGRDAPSTLAIAGNEIQVRGALANGDFTAAADHCAFTMHHARRSLNPTAYALTLAEGIFNAWLRGDDTEFDDLAAELDTLRAPSVIPGTRLLRACVGGNVQDLPADVAPAQLHAYAYLIALSWTRGEMQRRVAFDAVEASDKANDPFLQCLTRVALSLVDGHAQAHTLVQAQRFAEETDSEPLREAVRILRGRAIPKFFQAMADRIADVSGSPGTYRLSVLDGSLHRCDQRLYPSKREFELLAYLAYRDCELSKDELAEAFAPDADSGAADRLLRVTVTRIRKKFGDELIISGRGTYELGPDVDVRLRSMRARAERCESQETPSDADCVALSRDLQLIENYLEGRRPDFEWGEEFDAFLERLAASIRKTLQRARVLTSTG